MDINLLAISIGNTSTQIGVFLNGELDQHTTLPNTQIANIKKTLTQQHALIEDSEEPIAFIASVNDSIAAVISDFLTHDLNISPMRLEKDVSIPIGRQLDPESIIGDDRLLNAASAYDTLKEAVIIVDAGTAITIDFVDGQGTFQGGAILPGAQMMLNALHQHTQQLPELTFSTPDETVGHNTAQAMLTGVFHGIRGAVRELVEKYAEIYMAYPRVIATGGNAPALFDGYELVEKIVPELTLLGIATTYRLILKDAQED